MGVWVLFHGDHQYASHGGKGFLLSGVKGTLPRGKGVFLSGIHGTFLQGWSQGAFICNWELLAMPSVVHVAGRQLWRLYK